MVGSFPRGDQKQNTIPMHPPIQTVLCWALFQRRLNNDPCTHITRRNQSLPLDAKSRRLSLSSSDEGYTFPLATTSDSTTLRNTRTNTQQIKRPCTSLS